ncbi:MAG: hypothetical protein A4E53_00039 [Pelotomaculum sp. PtaB.Bin104]|nr:MAG: hypothetical protein A4E53_00039 [Pelotomaculum sp. PtaB.Bin104]
MASLTKPEVYNPHILPKVEKAACDPRAKTIIVHDDVRHEAYEKYEKLAKENGLQFTVRYNPDYKGDIGLVVVSDQAVE